MNKFILIGRLVKDPHIVKSNQNVIANITLAVSRNKEEADFVPVKLFGKTAELVEKYLQKGSKILVEGKIKSGKYEKNNTLIYTLEHIAHSIEFLDSKNSKEEYNSDADISCIGIEELESCEGFDTYEE